jgi:hypothetical protein
MKLGEEYIGTLCIVLSLELFCNSQIIFKKLSLKKVWKLGTGRQNRSCLGVGTSGRGRI